MRAAGRRDCAYLLRCRDSGHSERLLSPLWRSTRVGTKYRVNGTRTDGCEMPPQPALLDEVAQRNGAGGSMLRRVSRLACVQLPMDAPEAA